MNSDIPPQSAACSTTLAQITGTTICSVKDYKTIAKLKLPKAVFEYLSSGSDDEQTVSENYSAFKTWYLHPRCLVRPLQNLSTTITIQFHQTSTTTISCDYPEHIRNQTLQLPLFISPAGVHGLFEPKNGECATARACAKKGIMFGLSQHSTRTIEEIGQLATNLQHQHQQYQQTDCSKPLIWWYQAYILKDRSITIDLIERAVKAGCYGIFITVDSVKFGYREADVRNEFNSLPKPHRLVNYDKYGSSDSNRTEMSRSHLDKTYNGKQYQSWDQNSELLFDPNVTWDDIRWIKCNTACRYVPLVIKGIMTPQDAIHALSIGCADGIMVSNHGGRQLDGCLATIDALPSIVDAVRLYEKSRNANRFVQQPFPIWIDGGIQRGTDVLKALGLGATAVGIGKSMFYGLASNGQQGVEHVISMIHTELQTAMALTGCCAISDVNHNTTNTVTYNDSTSTICDEMNSYSIVSRHPRIYNIVTSNNHASESVTNKNNIAGISAL